MTNCVTPQQKKSAEYKAAMERFNIPSSVLETLLHEYQNLPENAKLFQEGKLSFPSDSWLQEHLYAPASVVNSQKQIDIYNEKFSKPIVVNTIEAANNIINKAAKYFDRNSIKAVETLDGKYQVLVSEQVLVKRDERGNLLAPNDKISNLTEEQYIQVRTKAFKEWFGDWEKNPEHASKVVDENGEPLVVYHGTPYYGFNSFNIESEDNKNRTTQGTKKGIYFAKDIENAEMFSIPNEVSIASFLEHASLNDADYYFLGKAKYGLSKEEIDSIFDRIESGYYKNLAISPVYTVFLNIRNLEEIDAKKQALYQLEKKELEVFNNAEDGVVIYNVLESINPEVLDLLGGRFSSNGQHPFTTDYVVFNPSQIKSAERNIGTFSTASNNIYLNKTIDLINIVKNIDWTEGNSFVITGTHNLLYKERGSYYITLGNFYNDKSGIIDFPRVSAHMASNLANVGINPKSVKLILEPTRHRIRVESNDAISKNERKLISTKSIETTLAFLEAKIPGLSHRIVSDNIATQKKYGISANVNAFFKDGTVYLVEGRFNEDIAIEECLHPLVNALAYQNNELFNKLVEEAKETFPTLYEEIQKSYDAKSVNKELVTQALSRHTRNEIHTQEGTHSKWEELKNKFYNFIKDLFGNIQIQNIIPTTTFKELAKIILSENGTFDISLKGTEFNKTEETNKSENQQFFEEQYKLAEQLDKVYGIDTEFSAEEFRRISQDIAYTISDIITEVQQNPEKATLYNSNANIDNLTNASRKDIAANLGIQNIIDFIKENYFGIGNTHIESFEDVEKANIIAENIDAFLKQGAAMLMQLEGFGIKEDGTLDTDVDNRTEELDPNNTTDEDAIQEVEGSLQEHWQIESRTQNAFDKASTLVRQALTQCYQLDKNGDVVVDKWGIKQRMDGRAALQSIMKWTQGALSLSSMITKLEAQAAKNKWIQPILDRLKDTSGKESSFQSQFFGTVSKYFQLYSVGKKQNGVYSVFEVNTHPALTEAKKGIIGLYNAGAHPLFDSNGRVNESGLNQLKSLWESLQGKQYTEDTASELAETLSAVSQLLGYPIAEDALLEVLNPTSFKQMTSRSLQFIIKDLEKNIKNEAWQPFSGNTEDNGIINNIAKFIEPITERLEDVTNTSFYDSGNMYQSYVTPSYVTKLVQKFSNSTQQEFENFIEDEYGKYRQFKIDNVWRNSWLALMDTQEGARQVLTHKVQLNFNGNRYMTGRGGAKAMSDVELTLSLLSEYFKENGQNTKNELATAWFRIPLMANKPSSEFIRFYSYRGDNYKNRVLNGCMLLFGQEISRIQTVKERAKVYAENSPELIKNFDGKRGLSFCFFDFLNKADNHFKDLVKKVTENTATEGETEELSRMARDLIAEKIDSEFKTQLEIWRKDGIVEEAKKIKGIDENFVEGALENFFWNDFLAANNILNLTITDLAYYKNTEDVQKRLAQLHAPGIRANIEARDFNGNSVADSKTRTLYLKDVVINPETLKSNILENVKIVFDRKLKELEGTPQYNAAKATYESIEKSFENGINVADAQGYASPTSYRKKALLFGKWDTHSEEIYQKLMSGKYTYNDLQTVFQPLKPFVYTQIEKDSGVDNASLPTLKMGVQNKNSEYLLILANAITQNEDTGKPNYLRAIYEIMEESHRGETDSNGNHIPRTDGIDTVQFESTVKTGLTGVIDITKAESTDEAKQLLEDLIYTDKANHLYNKTFVQELNLEDYAIQQEVPEHFTDHEQQQGSQIRMITVSDLNPNATYEVEGRKVSANDFRTEYEGTIAKNIQESIDELKEEFFLKPESTTKEKNIALAKVLQKEILSSPRYGLDLLMSCLLDENGNFKLPLGDPIQSKRIEQLINSIVKNRVNKQKIPGGPIVQVSNFGTSRQLNIRFKGKDGAVLETLNDYLNKGKTEEEWIQYIKENQSGIAYYEAFVPAYTQNIFRDFMDSEGNIDIEAIEQIDPELLKLIGYRIPSEDKYSMAPIKIVGFMPKEAGDGIMLPYEITLITGSDFDVDKFYIMRKDIPIRTKRRKEIFNALKNKFGKNEIDKIDIFLDQISNSKQRDIAKADYPELWKEYVKVAYKSVPYTEGRQYRNNKIVDMTWEVLTHEDSADKVLNPGGFEEQKYEGYLAQASRITGKPLSELEAEASSEKSPIDYLKNICSTNKNLAFIGTHTQFYKQNSAAGSILAIFAVAKVAHACLESNGFQVDTEKVCQIEKPVSIMGLTLFDKVELDPQKDIEGNFIGKTLGSLVASAADAVKDPVLNLMNINADTVNILNTLVRMGLPFRKAARLLSTQVVSDLLTRYNVEKLTNITSFNNVLDTMLTEISESNGDLSDSSITTEDLTDKEVEDSILKRNDKTDFKILLALQRINKINSAMRSLNFATRFNSISSAVGPLIIDNLKIEYNLKNFAEGIYHDGIAVTSFDEVFNLHPILSKFSDTVELVRELFGNHMPTYSYQFKQILDNINGSNLQNLFFRDRKVFSKFNDFYQSYLLVANNVVSSESRYLQHYLREFPTEFAKNNYKEKYAGNALIEAVRFDSDANSGAPILKINITGLDTEAKSKLSSGWLDLYKSGNEGKKLASDLFYYCFYKGGIGFNPKTFMSLLPIQLKMNLKGYKETFNKLPDINSADLVNQFIRNNWNDDKIVPYRKFKSSLYIHDGGQVDFYGDDAKSVGNMLAFKTRVGRNTLLFIRESYDPVAETALFREASPLGNNGEFLEISTVTQKNSIFQSPTVSKKINTVGERTEDVTDITPDEEIVNNPVTEDEASKLADDLSKKYLSAEEKAQLQNLAKDKRFQAMRDIIIRKLEENEIEVNHKQVDDIVNKFC